MLSFPIAITSIISNPPQHRLVSGCSTAYNKDTICSITSKHPSDREGNRAALNQKCYTCEGTRMPRRVRKRSKRPLASYSGFEVLGRCARSCTLLYDNQNLSPRRTSSKACQQKRRPKWRLSEKVSIPALHPTNDLTDTRNRPERSAPVSSHWPTCNKTEALPRILLREFHRRYLRPSRAPQIRPKSTLDRQKHTQSRPRSVETSIPVQVHA